MKNLPEINPGDTVEIIIRGVAVDTKDPAGWLWVQDPDAGDYLFFYSGNSVVKSVTVVEKAKPKFMPLRNGDVFTYPNVSGEQIEYHVLAGQVFRTCDVSSVATIEWMNAYAAGEIKLLFRDGKQYNG